MTTQDRIANMENFMMRQSWMKGRSFRVQAVKGDPKFEFEIVFEELFEWQFGRIKNKVRELQWDHVKISCKKITPPQPKKDENRVQGSRPVGRQPDRNRKH